MFIPLDVATKKEAAKAASKGAMVFVSLLDGFFVTV
jgi:hypothetical protein